MKTPLALALAALVFVLVATANSGGYRYGVSDQAFYQPAIAMSADGALFPRDRVVLLPQMRLWVGDSLIGALVRVSGAGLPTVFLWLYVVTLLALAGAAISLARRLGMTWWTVAIFLVLLTLRHRIAKTGANSLEGYMHPRMLAFAIGLASFAAIARGRTAMAVFWTAAAMLVHTTTGLWFGVVTAAAALWTMPRPRAALALGMGGAAAAMLALAGPFAGRLQAMDAAWLAVLDDRDYLFSAAWPAYAWIANLAYVAVIALSYRHRRALAITTRGEGALVAGLLALVLVFFVSVPLTESRMALAVQMQVNRVFWLLDAVALLYLAWWLMEIVSRGWRPAARTAAVATLLGFAAARGYYVVHVAGQRPLFERDLPATTWTDAMAWLRAQPSSWHVLADPQHVWKYGPSVRVAAGRDTLLEVNKDAALAIYDRGVAMRVEERRRALDHFDGFSAADIRALAATYGLDVFVDRRDRTFPFPILYRNDDFAIYDLR